MARSVFGARAFERFQLTSLIPRRWCLNSAIPVPSRTTLPDCHATWSSRRRDSFPAPVSLPSSPRRTEYSLLFKTDNAIGGKIKGPKGDVGEISGSWNDRMDLSKKVRRASHRHCRPTVADSPPLGCRARARRSSSTLTRRLSLTRSSRPRRSNRRMSLDDSGAM